MKPSDNNRSKKGFSLVEAIVIIAIVGILSALAVPMVTRVKTGSEETIGENLVATLNNATREFDHAQYRLYTDGEDNTSDDEVHILQTLQWTDPDIEFGVAGPFMRPDWAPGTSDDIEDYRIVWAGSFWKLVEPGTAGVGLKVDFDAKDTNSSDVLGADFTPFPPYVPADPPEAP